MSNPNTDTFESFDGTSIYYWRTGNPRKPALVIANGLGVGHSVWAEFFKHFGSDYHIIGWDYRGLGSSGEAPNKNSYTVEHHTGDLVALLDHLELPNAIVLGWSMGVQVALELQREHPERSRALVLANGSPGSVLRKLMKSDKWTQKLHDVCSKFARREQPLGITQKEPSAPSPLLQRLAKAGAKMGILGRNINLPAFSVMIQRWITNDVRIYPSVFLSLDLHDASELLPNIQVPVLVIIGERDYVTPLQFSEQMAEDIPDAQLVVVPRATHFALVEEPGASHAAIETFLNSAKLAPLVGESNPAPALH